MKHINIKIRPVDGKNGQFVAFAQSEFLDATYSVFFKDSIFGSVALNRFSEMIRNQYNNCKVNFVISTNKITLQNPALFDVMTGRNHDSHHRLSIAK